MGQNPCLSVGMPLYHAEEFLEETLDSLLAQTFDDFEIIISDNASIDRTASICHSYMSKEALSEMIISKSSRPAETGKL